jgi:hypothetical protein
MVAYSLSMLFLLEGVGLQTQCFRTGMSEIEFFDWSRPVQMNGTGFLKNTIPGQSCPVESNKIPFMFVQQKIQFNDRTGPGMKFIYHSISFILLNLIYLIKS